MLLGELLAPADAPADAPMQYITPEDAKGLLDDSGYVVANEDGRTSQEGFFVAGDVRTKTLRQVVTAVSDGANAITSVAEDIKIGAIGDGV